MYASLQFCGNIEEYFSKNTKKLVVFIVMPRLGNKFNLIRIYKNGKLEKEKKVKSSENIFTYYFLWLYYHWYILIRHFSRQEKLFLITGHPVALLGLSLQRFIRKVKHVYWIGDYFPGDGFIIKNFERLKKYYHDKVLYSAYLSDRINEIFNNGKIVDTKKRKTIMWGVKPYIGKNKKISSTLKLFFVGIIREQQGIENIFNFLKNNKNISISILGACEKNLYKKYIRQIKKNKIASQVFFPNKNYYDKDLKKIALNSDVGIALYDEGESNVTYYADPAKIKTYTQMGLPVIMTNTSVIADYIKKFNAGVVLSEKIEIDDAMDLFRKNPRKYFEGLNKFNNYFNYEKYYNEKFEFLEK